MYVYLHTCTVYLRTYLYNSICVRSVDFAYMCTIPAYVPLVKLCLFEVGGFVSAV